MSYDESVKKQAYDMYVEFMKDPDLSDRDLIKEVHKKIKKEIPVCKNIDITTLRGWRQDDDWLHRARVEVLFSSQLKVTGIPDELLKHITPDNAVEMGRLWLDAVLSTEKGANNETSNDSAGTHRDEKVDAGETPDFDTTISPIFDELRRQAEDD